MKNNAVILGNVTLPGYLNGNQPYSWFVKTFQQGLELNNYNVIGIPYKQTNLDNIKTKIEEIKPKFVFCHLTFHKTQHNLDQELQLYSDLNKKHNIKFIHTLGDARTEGRYTKDISKAFHCAFVSNKTIQNNMGNKWNIPIIYCPYSSLTYNKIGNIDNNLKFKEAVFTGGVTTHPDRHNFIKKIQKYIPIKTFATQSNQDLRHKTLELSRNASSILGLCTGYNIKGYIDVRPFQYLGAGAMFIARAFPYTDYILPRDLYFDFDGYEEEDAIKVRDYYQRILTYSESFRYSMQEKAFNYMQQNHSSKIRISQILKAIKDFKDFL